MIHYDLYHTIFSLAGIRKCRNVITASRNRSVFKIRAVCSRNADFYRLCHIIICKLNIRSLCPPAVSTAAVRHEPVLMYLQQQFQDLSSLSGFPHIPALLKRSSRDSTAQVWICGKNGSPMQTATVSTTTTAVANFNILSSM